MKKATLNYLVDVCLFVLIVSSGITGLIKFPGLLQYLGMHSRDLPMQQINFVHDWSGAFMVIFVLIHLILHWRWIVAMTKSYIFRA